MNGAPHPIYAKALQLIDRLDDEFLQLALLLGQIKAKDPDAFRDLITERGLGRRKAYYLLAIEKAFGDIAHTQRERLSRIGWTKLQIVAASVTPQNREKLLRLAEKHTAEDLKTLTRGDQPIAGRKAVLLYFSPEQYKTFAKAIVKHGAIKSGDGFTKKEEAVIRAVRWK